MKWDRQIKSFTSLNGVDDGAAVEMQRRLQASHVLVLGVGGVGGYLALGLAMVGVGRLTLVDHDVVELSNTARQVLYDEGSIGRPKLEIAEQNIRQHNPAVDVLTIAEEVTSSPQLIEMLRAAESRMGKIDLLVVNADTPRGTIAYIVDEACAAVGVPSIYMGPHDFSQVTIGPLVVPDVTPRYSEHFPRRTVDLDSPAVVRINERFRANIMDPMNGLAAKMGAIEVCKYLSGYREPRTISSVFTIDTDDWTIEEFDLGT
jgi:hypothetical protein